MEDNILKLKMLEANRLRLWSWVREIYEGRLNLDTKTKLRGFRSKTTGLEELRAEFKGVIEEINMIQMREDPKFMPNLQELDKFDRMYFEIKDLVSLSDLERPGGGKENPPESAPEVKPRLPKIDLIDFDGDVMKWPVFFENFKHLVHENPSLDPISKVHYLLGKLKGNALAVCAGILPTAENYPILWEALIHKYDDKRALADVYLRQILSCKPTGPEDLGTLSPFVDKIDAAVRALRQLQIDDLGDYMLTSVCLEKIDPQTRLLFERSLGRDEFPTFDQFTDFLKEHCRILTRSTDRTTPAKNRGGKALPTKSFPIREGKTRTGKKGCEMCGNLFHRIHHCPKFVALSQVERKRVAQKQGLCYNCLGAGHAVNQCPSSYRCNECQQNHHSLLHGKQEDTEGEPEEPATSTVLKTLVSTESNSSTKYTTLLATAVVLARAKGGKDLRMRVLIDSGSECSFITRDFCRRLNLTVTPVSTAVSGIGAAVTRVRGQVTLSFKSRFQPQEYKVKAWVIDQITDHLPSSEVDKGLREALKERRLADDSFTVPGAIDGILGATLFPQLIGPVVHLKPGWPSILESPLGDILIGRAPTNQVCSEMQTFCCTTLKDLVQQFWELETVGDEPVMDPDDLACEEAFKKTTRREADGRYTVALPFKNFPPSLGESKQVALRRFLSLERKFTRSPEYAALYRGVMQDYLDQGHLKLVETDTPKPHYYIPHHGILKSQSSTTPLRVVFDASAKSSDGQALNDVMFTGPKLQIDIFDVLIRFRLFEVAMTADVKQMYRQIWICPEHQSFQRILWRFNREESIRTYELTTVTFGLKASPFLALRTIQQLAADESKNFPLAAERVSRELYMDDVVSSIAEPSTAKKLYDQWVGLFKAGGLHLTKWATNSPELLRYIPRENRRGGVVDFPTDILTVLGLRWSPESDDFNFAVKIDEILWTKRTILSTMARIWDPLGLLTPVTVKIKLLLKELWDIKKDWDDPLPTDVQTIWESFVSELPALASFTVPRHLGVRLNSRAFLVGFADASEKAYAATIYLLVSQGEDSWESRLVCAKAKVAPMKAVSIPRLELCAALLLARLLRVVRKIYQSVLIVQGLYAFSDSTVVLHWLQGASHRWKSFVANRVVKIQEYLPDVTWFHVKGEENPADLASRGSSPQELLQNSLWLNGPPWLAQRPEKWSIEVPNLDESIDLEERPVRCLITTTEECPIDRLIERCGSWSKLLKVVIFVLRFGRKLPLGEIKTTDYDLAEVTLTRVVQRRHFSHLIDSLSMKKTVDKSFRCLTPFLQDGVIRVGGRLRNSNLVYEQRHPILLPKKGHFTQLLLQYLHLKYLHAGPTLLAGLVRQRYWILGARDLIRRLVQNCNHCFRVQPSVRNPLMADLPIPRVEEAKPFTHTGMDFAGPFRISLSRTRGAKVMKGYLCLFICLATRAVHLEGASDLTTEACLAAIKRFLARRGPVSVFYSDRGTNFVGAKRHLNELGHFLASSELRQKIGREFTEQRIEWRLNPPAAPHFGGSWEAGVKSVKFHLVRIVGDQILTFEEFTTVLCQIEAVLNSRPLCWLSTDPADPVALTPAHFLTLTPLNSLLVSEDIPSSNRLHRKALLDKLVQGYWKRWRLEYLSLLQKRMKWNTPSCPMEPGMLVLVHQENVPPLNWPIGRIQEVYPGRDGVVRVALVKTKTGLFKRVVHKLAPLPTQ